MRKTTAMIILVFLLSTVFLMFNIRPAKTETGIGEATIYVSPQLSNFTSPLMYIGNSFTVTVRVSSYTHVAAWQVKLLYNSEQLRTSISSVSYASDFIFPPHTYVIITPDTRSYNSTHNYVIMASATYGAVEYEGADAGLVAVSFFIKKTPSLGETFFTILARADRYVDYRHGFERKR